MHSLSACPKVKWIMGNFQKPVRIIATLCTYSQNSVIKFMQTLMSLIKWTLFFAMLRFFSKPQASWSYFYWIIERKAITGFYSEKSHYYSLLFLKLPGKGAYRVDVRTIRKIRLIHKTYQSCQTWLWIWLRDDLKKCFI